VGKAHRRWKRRAPRSGGGPGGGAPWLVLWTLHDCKITQLYRSMDTEHLSGLAVTEP
jgi:hypothetical protein